jgi:glycosyltransferase involved in cell wall biosynthesis
MLSRFDERIIDYGIHHADAIVVQTQHQADLLLRYYGRSDATLIRNFHPLPDNLPERAPEPITITWVANIKAFKRPEAFVQLAEDLRERSNVRLIMIGAPPLADSRWPALLAKIQAQPNLLYLGGLSQEAVNDCISRSHIFVNTSVHEGFANTFIQAWMRGVPVVSLAVDPDGLLGCGKYGYCAGGNYHAFRSHIEALIDNPALRQTLGEQAKHYSYAAHSNRNIELLINILLPDTAGADSSSSEQL